MSDYKNGKSLIDRICIIAGMPRTATTSLYQILPRHPACYVPFRKETNYFSVNHKKGREWYIDLFRNAAPDQVCFDISPLYFFDVKAIDRILNFNPQAKVIIGVRDPHEWSLSMYNQACSSDFAVPPFEDFLREYRFNFGEGKNQIILKLNEGQITTMIDKYRSAFQDNLLIFEYEFFKKEPLAALKVMEKFLDLPSFFDETTFENVFVNTSGRRNIKLVTYLASREKFVSFVKFIFPDALIRSARAWLDTRLARDTSPANPQDLDTHRIELARNILARDIEYKNRLFAQSHILLGSGKSVL